MNDFDVQIAYFNYQFFPKCKAYFKGFDNKYVHHKLAPKYDDFRQQFSSY